MTWKTAMTMIMGEADPAWVTGIKRQMRIESHLLAASLEAGRLPALSVRHNQLHGSIDRLLTQLQRAQCTPVDQVLTW